MKKLSLALTLFLVACSGSSPSIKSTIPITEYQLSNGLRVILAPQLYTKLTTVLIDYNVGGIFETQENLGLSHLLEHLMFKSTKNLKSGEFNLILEKDLGGSFNAMTSYDATTYYETFPEDGTQKVLELEAERMQNLTLNKEEVDKEKLVVLEEMRNRIENSDMGFLITKANEFFYKDFPYGRDLGGRENIQQISLETIKSYYHNYYAPNNATLIITGAIKDLSLIKAWVKQYFEPISSQSVLMPEVSKDFTPPTNQTLALKRPTNTNYVVMMSKIKQGRHPSMNTLKLISSLLTVGNSSYLEQELVVKNQLVSQIFMGPDISKLPSAFTIFFTPYRKEDIPKIVAIIKSTLNMIEKDPELESRIKTQELLNLTQFYNLVQIPSNIAFELAEGLRIGNDPYFSINQNFVSVSKDEVVKKAKELAQQDFTTVLMLKD